MVATQKGRERKYPRNDQHPNWNGGTSKEREIAHNRIEYKNWRTAVFKRDNYTCQAEGCGVRGGYNEAHHIKSWADYPEVRYDIANGITLCKKCHDITKGRNKNE